MPRLKRLSGAKVIAILGKFGFVVHSQHGSHVKLKRITQAGSSKILTIPRHNELDLGTIHAIYHQAGRFIPEDELRKEFYIE